MRGLDTHYHIRGGLLSPPDVQGPLGPARMKTVISAS